jgi:hypothetical protein
MFWMTVIVSYILTWIVLDQTGVISWFAYEFVQPHINPEHDAYGTVTLFLLLILPLLGPAAKKGKK